MSSPAAFEYGRFLGGMQRSINEMFRQISLGFAAEVRPRSAMTAEARELRLEADYRRRIAREREAGLRFVRQEADQLRRRLGLPIERRTS